LDILTTETLNGLVTVGITAMMVKAVTNQVNIMEARSRGHHSISGESLIDIASRYGWWQARRAESMCPDNDVSCVEENAKRLYEKSKFPKR